MSEDSTTVVPPSPPARRTKTPSWLDLRLALGVLLVLVSVVLGARVVSAADNSVQVWGVTATLAAGTTLTDQDVRPVKVRLYADADRYLRAAQRPVGRTLNRAVNSGELLPSAALGSPPSGQMVSLPVSALHAPDSLAHGQQVDVFATTSRTAGGTGQTVRVLSGVTVQSVRRPSGGISGSGEQLAVLVRVAAHDAAAVITAVNGASLDVTIVLGGESEPDSSAVPTGSGSPSASPGATRSVAPVPAASPPAPVGAPTASPTPSRRP